MFSLKLYMLPNLLSHIIGCDTGSTALSATLYDCGQTAYSVFGIPVQDVGAL
jgi:hypothetical protein